MIEVHCPWVHGGFSPKCRVCNDFDCAQPKPRQLDALDGKFSVPKLVKFLYFLFYRDGSKFLRSGGRRESFCPRKSICSRKIHWRVSFLHAFKLLTEFWKVGLKQSNVPVFFQQKCRQRNRKGCEKELVFRLRK